MTLPDGIQGKLLAVLLLGLLGVAVSVVLVRPLLAWHEGRAQVLLERRSLAMRFETAQAELPHLRAEVAALGAGHEHDSLTLPGQTETLAIAGLQAALRDLVARHGGNVESAEALPARPQSSAPGQNQGQPREGSLQRVGVRMQTAGDIFLLASILEAIDAAAPPLLIDSLQVRSELATGGDRPVEASTPSLRISLDVLGFWRP